MSCRNARRVPSMALHRLSDLDPLSSSADSASVSKIVDRVLEPLDRLDPIIDETRSSNTSVQSEGEIREMLERAFHVH